MAVKRKEWGSKALHLSGELALFTKQWKMISLEPTVKVLYVGRLKTTPVVRYLYSNLFPPSLCLDV